MQPVNPWIILTAGCPGFQQKGPEYGPGSGSSWSDKVVYLVRLAGRAGFIGCPEGQKTDIQPL